MLVISGHNVNTGDHPAACNRVPQKSGGAGALHPEPAHFELQAVPAEAQAPRLAARHYFDRDLTTFEKLRESFRLLTKPA